MAFKSTLTQDEYDALDPVVQKEYVQSGENWNIQVTGMVPKKQLDDFRKTNIDQKKILEKFGDLDPDEVLEIMSKKEEIEAAASTQGEKIVQLVEERVGKIKKELETKLEKATGDSQRLRKQLEKEKIDKALIEAGTKQGIRASAIEDLLGRGGRVFKLGEDGESVVALDGDGNPIYEGSEVLTIETFVSKLAKDADHLFEPSSGADTTGGAKKPAPGGVNPWKKETWNFTKQGEMIRADRAKARTMAAQAGAAIDF